MGPVGGRDDVFFFPFSGAGGVGVLVALCAGGDGGEGAGCGDDGEGGRGDGRSVCMGAVVLAVSLMSALRHRTTPCSVSHNVFSPSPSNKVESKIVIVSNYLLNYDEGVARGVSAFHEL